MFKYSKNIQLSSDPDRPSQTPRQNVGEDINQLQSSSRQHVETRKQRAERLKKQKKELFDYWMDNGDRFDIKEDHDFDKFLISLDNQTIAREAYVLLSLIKKYWGETEAQTAYNGAWEGTTFDLSRLRFFFTVVPKIVKDEKPYGFKANGGRAKTELGIYWKASKGAWYVWNNRTKSKDIRIGPYLHVNWDKGKAGLSNSNVEYLVDQNRRQEVTSFIEEQNKKVTISDKEMDKKIIPWMSKKAVNRWTALPEELHYYMLRKYGKRTGYYVYRYNPSKKRIYAMRIKGAALKSSEDGTAAYIDIKNGGLDTWHGYRNGKDFLKADLLDEMDPVDVEKELVDFKGKENPQSLTDAQKLVRTKGAVAGLSGVPSNVSYTKLDKDYLNVVKKKLIASLKPKLGAQKAEEYATLRIKELRKSIEAAIDEKKDTLRKSIEDDSSIKIEISVDSEDNVEVAFASTKDKVKYSKLAKKAKEAAKEGNVDNLADQKTKDILKKMGPLGTILQFFGVDLKEDMLNYLKTGKKSAALWIATSITSVELGRRVLSGKGISSTKALEKLAKKNDGVLKKDQEITKKDIKLTDYKITIPKGKGIKLSKTFVANGETLDEAAKEKDSEEKEKKSSFFSGLFSFGKSSSSDKFMYKDKEIVIAKNDTIPEGTVLPKGAKIEKV